MTSRDRENRLFRAGEIAALTGVSTDTLRHYERKGVLPRPERSANGYRQYPVEAIARVSLVQSALVIGFTLDELATVLRAKDRGRIPCQEVRTMAEEKLSVLEERLRELTGLRDALKATLREWDEQLAHTPTGERAHLLEGLEVRTLNDGREPSSRAKEVHDARSRLRPHGRRSRDIDSRDG